ncbi:hypothetical protein AAFF_G00211710 [Aldrovandia affinis]|uniref:Uncharacterized protein n=1 Tax=Aldrovandia affinis TaxID=143900 RepID=A0AAD7WV55_9TELE|nr:hypothetical protein AAFF_G00211710 [Aldrovandia affinis]
MRGGLASLRGLMQSDRNSGPGSVMSDGGRTYAAATPPPGGSTIVPCPGDSTVPGQDSAWVGRKSRKGGSDGG